jgi:hypothetical protein
MEAERRLKSGRKKAERYLKFTNKKLHQHYLNLKEISEKRRIAAESRYHANAPAKAPANDQSAFASASASAFAPKTKSSPNGDHAKATKREVSPEWERLRITKTKT